MIKSIINNLKKDILIETRDKSPLLNSLVFSLISASIAGLIMGPGDCPVKIKALLYWLIIFFSAGSSLGHIFIREKERETILLLKLSQSPLPVFIAKLILNLVIITIMITLITLVFFILIRVDIKSYCLFIISIYGGGLAITATICLPAVIAAEGGTGNTTFTIISFPIIFPVLWINIRNFILATQKTGLELTTVLFYTSYPLLFIIISAYLYKFTWQQE